MYVNGEGVPKDAAQAVNWYRKSAEQGNASAQFNLGLMCFLGDGVAKDAVEAGSGTGRPLNRATHSPNSTWA
jgi:TPR repeat protein